MTWVKLDDGFADHPKTVGLSPAAVALHVWALCYCNRHTTDGLVPRGATNACAWVADTADAIAELVNAGLWTADGRGHRIHDYLDYQPSADKVRLQRTRKTERQARWRANKHGSVDAPVDASTKGAPPPPPKGGGRARLEGAPTTCAYCDVNVAKYPHADDCERPR
jgi:hypothetical protein